MRKWAIQGSKYRRFGGARSVPIPQLSQALFTLFATGFGRNRVDGTTRTDKQGFAIGPAECKAGGALRGFQSADLLAGLVIYFDVAAGDVDVAVGVCHNGVAAAVGER